MLKHEYGSYVLLITELCNFMGGAAKNIWEPTFQFLDASVNWSSSKEKNWRKCSATTIRYFYTLVDGENNIIECPLLDVWLRKWESSWLQLRIRKRCKEIRWSVRVECFNKLSACCKTLAASCVNFQRTQPSLSHLADAYVWKRSSFCYFRFQLLKKSSVSEFCFQLLFSKYFRFTKI